MSPLVLSGVGISADRLPLPSSYLLPESPPPPPPVMAVAVRKRNLICLHEEPAADSSSETSSIGAVDEDEDEDEESGELESNRREDGGGGAFDSLDSLEDSLPIKRGLSKFYSGKSKSFANIPDIAAATKVNVLSKPENPFNKRRRLARRGAFTCVPPPPLSPNEEEEEDAINGDGLVSLPSLLIH